VSPLRRRMVSGVPVGAMAVLPTVDRGGDQSLPNRVVFLVIAGSGRAGGRCGRRWWRSVCREVHGSSPEVWMARLLEGAVGFRAPPVGGCSGIGGRPWRSRKLTADHDGSRLWSRLGCVQRMDALGNTSHVRQVSC
jgi:hypothetical protein